MSTMDIMLLGENHITYIHATNMASMAPGGPGIVSGGGAHTLNFVSNAPVCFDTSIYGYICHGETIS